MVDGFSFQKFDQNVLDVDFFESILLFTQLLESVDLPFAEIGIFSNFVSANIF